ncbi:MAG TPA: hypothetical protein VJJ80_02900 [Patescibacteria group bacterium]|nr:hypothetical protein [Patescibacteria group bacterium]
MRRTARTKRKFGDPNYRFLYFDKSRECREAKRFIEALGVAYHLLNIAGYKSDQKVPFVMDSRGNSWQGLEAIKTYWVAWALSGDISTDEEQIIRQRANELLRIDRIAENYFSTILEI